MEKRIYQDSRTAYLVIEPETDIETDNSLSMNMMKNNKIQCFLDMECRYVDNNLALYYKIQGLQCMKEYIEENKLDYATAKQLYLDIVQAVINGGEFFLDENSYILDLEYIYWDKKNKQAKLCCVPEWKGDFQKDAKKLSEDIIAYIDHSDKAAEKFIYDIYSLISDDGFVAADIKSYIKEFKLNKTEARKDSSAESVQQNDVQVQDVCRNSQTRVKYGLSIEKASMPLSIWKKGRTDIWTNSAISIGRHEDCNVVLPFNIISRHHAVINIIDGNFYVEDTASTNGTSVNGKKIPANEKTLCIANDIISFAGINCRVISCE